MLTSVLHVRSSGGLVKDICSITLVLHTFLKGHIEAMLIKCSDERKT